MMSWVTLQILSMILASGNSILDKHLVSKHEPSPLIYLGSFAVVGLPITTVGLWLIPWPGALTAITGMLSGLIFSVAVLGYYWALNFGDVSRLVPILRLSSIFKLVLLAIFLKDRLLIPQYVAFALMFIGAVALAHKPKALGHQRFLEANSAVLMMMIVAFLLAISATLGGQIVLSHSPWVLMAWSSAGQILGFCSVLLIPQQRKRFFHTLDKSSKKFRMVVVLEQLSRQISELLTDFAVLGAGSVALISVFAGIRPFIVMAMAMLFLNERFKKKEVGPKLFGLSFICTGTLMLFYL